MTLPVLLAVELASGGFNVANPCDSTAVAYPEPLSVETSQARMSKIKNRTHRTRTIYKILWTESTTLLQGHKDIAFLTALATALAINGGTALPICWYCDRPFSHDILVRLPTKTYESGNDWSLAASRAVKFLSSLGCKKLL